MTIYEKFYAEKELHSVIFYDRVDYRTILDIDILFRMTNKTFAELLKNLGLEVNFNFSTRDNKKLYTHEFIKNICDWMKYDKNGDCGSSWFFYSNVITKDPFRNAVIKKMKTIFGFKIWEEAFDFETFVDKVEKRDCSIMSGLEVMFNSDRKPKSLRKVKKSLEKMGLVYLNEIYFDDILNKKTVVG